MTKRSVSLLLIISLAFNIAFLGSFAFHFINKPSRPPFMECEINPKAKSFYMERRKHMKDFFHKFHTSKDEFITYLGSEEFNEEQVMELLEKTVKNQMDMEREMGLSMIEMRKHLTAEEAKEIFRNFRFKMDKMREHFPKRIKKIKSK